MKGKKILKRKVYRHAAQLPPIPDKERVEGARRCLDSPGIASKKELTALAQAKIEYVRRLFELCGRFRAKVFASMVNPASELPVSRAHLRKDYAYLFERFFYFLEDQGAQHSGIVVFDELEKSRSHILLEQMDSYFKRTTKGQQRSGLIIPEPFFVHSELTTGVQLADLVAYILSWNFRLPGMNEPKREEMSPLTQEILGLRHKSVREIGDDPGFVIWSLAYIDDLRPKTEREE